jgi:AcrR family transcriptional regulator
MKSKSTTSRRGRPRAFDADKALEQAMRVFWKKGYEGASLPELTKAMGINRPSMYAVFGNKEALFRKALDRYSEGACSMMQEALSAPTARETVERLLRGAVGLIGSTRIRGCLLVQGALACGDGATPIREELAARRGLVESALKDRFARALAEGDLSAGSNPAALAKYVATFQQGLAVQSASGANREELLAAVEVALSAWPR